MNFNILCIISIMSLFILKTFPKIILFYTQGGKEHLHAI